MDIHICIDVCACVHVCHTHTAFCIPYNYNSVSLNGIEKPMYSPKIIHQGH